MVNGMVTVMADGNGNLWPMVTETAMADSKGNGNSNG
jgi:hypothetical protein